MARRSGDDWWVGVMTNNDPRSYEISFDFLEPGAKYTARIFTDDPKTDTATHVRCDTRKVTSRTRITLPLQARGGAALILTKD